MTDKPIPYGYCHCGCGEKTGLTKQNVSSRGMVRGVPNKYINRHNSRKSPDEYVIEDHGYKTPCWIWQRAINGQGYGSGWFSGRSRAAHIEFYERIHGPVPEGLELDHLCRIRSCCNPEHVEAVTRKVNVLRGNSPGAISKRTNTCQRGHEFTPENTYITSNGFRRCRSCKKVADYALRQRKRQ